MRPERMPPKARDVIGDPSGVLAFSVVSVWEVTIKAALDREDFDVDPPRLREKFLAAGYRELEIAGRHALAVGKLPNIHRDPFDRLLLAQAACEGATLLTVDRQLARYPGDIHFVG